MDLVQGIDFRLMSSAKACDFERLGLKILCGSQYAACARPHILVDWWHKETRHNRSRWHKWNHWSTNCKPAA